MGVLDSLRTEVYSKKSLKTYSDVRIIEPLLKPYPTLISLFEALKVPGEKAGIIQDKILLRLNELPRSKLRGIKPEYFL